MPPADLLQIFIVGVLRVDNQDIDAVKEIDQPGASGRGISSCFLAVRTSSRVGKTDF